jgi:hypothetical protein
MSTLLSIGIKDSNGQWKNYTVSINDETNDYGKNVAIWEEQTKEQREAKEQKNFCGNGKVVWTDGKVVKAEQKPQPIEGISKEEKDDDGLPF